MLTLTALLVFTLASTSTSCADSSWLTRSHSCVGSPQVWEARPSPGKGLGVYATRTIEPGDIILSEPPIIHFAPSEFRDGVAYPLNDITATLQASFDALSPGEQAQVMSLHAYMTPAEKAGDQLMAIFRSNAYTTGDSLGLFPKGSRINHSCRPNTSQYWSANLGRRIVYANRHIEEGEEIYASYIPLLHPHEARQRRLDQYGFKCTCSACALDQGARNASDQRRQDLAKAFAAFESQLTLSVPGSVVGKRKARKNAEASIQLVEEIEKEGLADYYIKAYHIAAVMHARAEDWKPATLFANKGYETSLLADHNARSAGTKELQALTNHLINKWNDHLRDKAMEHGK
ncbi:SET domain-containing protein [Bimuria novae-zelandiae CBS 107.79]|uniref:SET domain-containing protein n=1 Tax=Bimuria novae-zelandiae CBS 107.79 TaxID=1447943 RepID=A0A6A5USH8_9PLEO|nr:SET domain-containing protein [Bimuria novae-zelandiae CBS 107.79]